MGNNERIAIICGATTNNPLGWNHTTPNILERCDKNGNVIGEDGHIETHELMESDADRLVSYRRVESVLYRCTDGKITSLSFREYHHRGRPKKIKIT